MARRAKYDPEQMLDAGLVLFSEEGLRGVSVAAIARRLGAPSGSVYHRFGSRDLLLAKLWLRTVARFQSGYLEALGDPPELEPAVRFVLHFCRENPVEARLLLLHRREDLLGGAWPVEVRATAQQLGAQLREGFARVRAHHGVDPVRIRLAAVSIPQGAVTPYLRSGEPLPPQLDDAVVSAARAAFGRGAG